MFAAMGALASEIMPTRSRAAGACAVVFGAAFMLRALGDAASSAHWLVYLSPLGWVEQLRPLSGAQPLWLLPIAGLVAVCAVATVLLADRDLSASLLADRDTAPCRTALLGSPMRFAWRMNWAVTTSWLAAAVIAGLLYGSLAKTTGQAFASSGMLPPVQRQPDSPGAAAVPAGRDTGLRGGRLPDPDDADHGLRGQRRRADPRGRGRGVPGQPGRAPGEQAALADGADRPVAGRADGGRGSGRGGVLDHGRQHARRAELP